MARKSSVRKTATVTSVATPATKKKTRIETSQTQTKKTTPEITDATADNKVPQSEGTVTKRITRSASKKQALIPFEAVKDEAAETDGSLKKAANKVMAPVSEMTSVQKVDKHSEKKLPKPKDTSEKASPSNAKQVNISKSSKDKALPGQMSNVKLGSIPDVANQTKKKQSLKVTKTTEAESTPTTEKHQEAPDASIIHELDSSAGEDSSDDGLDSDDEMVDHNDLFSRNRPVIALDPTRQDTVAKRLASSHNKPDNEDTGVVYIGRVPHGFYEDEMRGYFSQFGTVKRLRLSRNKKTGKSKHYAFIEFESREVAEIVADTMDNYLLFGHLLKCKMMDNSSIHKNLFDGADRKFKVLPLHKIAREMHNRPRTAEEVHQKVNRLIKNEDKKRKRIQAAGIDYDFPGFAASRKSKPNHIRF